MNRKTPTDFKLCYNERPTKITLLQFLSFFLFSVTDRKNPKNYKRDGTDFLIDSLKFTVYIILISFPSTSPSIMIIPKNHTLPHHKIGSNTEFDHNCLFSYESHIFSANFSPTTNFFKSPLYGN